jgi:hypothetical protein
MRAVVNVDKFTIVNGPGATKMLHAAADLLDGKSSTRLVFLVETCAAPHSMYPKALQCTTISKTTSGSREYPFYLSGTMDGVGVELLYTLNTTLPSRGEITEL